MLFIETICAAIYEIKKNNHSEKVDFSNIHSYRVIIPAHNEEAVIKETLVQLLSIVPHSSDILVVADNCQDQTARLAHKLNVKVIERKDEKKKGKGYALDFGIRHLASTPPDAVVFLDADCTVDKGNLQILVQEAIDRGVAVQSLYLMRAGQDNDIKMRIAAFAFVIKNYVRPLGLKQMGFPCLLTGTGIAIPWKIVKSINLATGDIVEDMRLGIELIEKKQGPFLYEKVVVTSHFPQLRTNQDSQRTRWEHGHIATLINNVPELLKRAFREKRMDLFIAGADLAVPPLSLLLLISLLFTVSTGSVAIALLDNSHILLIITLPLIIQGVTILLSWITFGKHLLTFQDIVLIPIYILSKIPIYTKYLIKKETNWVKTDRE